MWTKCERLPCGTFTELQKSTKQIWRKLKKIAKHIVISVVVNDFGVKAGEGGIIYIYSKYGGMPNISQ